MQFGSAGYAEAICESSEAPVERDGKRRLEMASQMSLAGLDGIALQVRQEFMSHRREATKRIDVEV